jgi:hypothetical protein
MFPVMKWKRCSWFLALLGVAGALILTSCMSEEGIAPGEGEMKGGSPSNTL